MKLNTDEALLTSLSGSCKLGMRGFVNIIILQIECGPVVYTLIHATSVLFCS